MLVRGIQYTCDYSGLTYKIENDAHNDDDYCTNNDRDDNSIPWEIAPTTSIITFNNYHSRNGTELSLCGMRIRNVIVC